MQTDWDALIEQIIAEAFVMPARDRVDHEWRRELIREELVHALEAMQAGSTIEQVEASVPDRIRQILDMTKARERLDPGQLDRFVAMHRVLIPMCIRAAWFTPESERLTNPPVDPHHRI